MANVRLKSYLSLIVFTKIIHFSFLAQSENGRIGDKLAHLLLVFGPRFIRDKGSANETTVGNRRE